MRLFVTSIALVLATSVAAEDQENNLMQEGLSLFLEGLSKEFKPALEDFADFAIELGPEIGAFIEHIGPDLRGLLDEVQDWTAYEAPEILPNGDIILRKKTATPEHTFERNGHVDL